MKSTILIFGFLIASATHIQAQTPKDWNIRLSYQFSPIGKSGCLGLERGFQKSRLELQMRFHQNRQYLMWDEPNFYNRVHAFTTGQFFGLGYQYSYKLPIRKLFAESMITLGGQYLHVGIKAQVLESRGVFYDSLFHKNVEYKEAIIKTFKPMHIYEQSLKLNFRFHVAGIFSMDYALGYSAVYEWGIDPALPTGSHQRKWLFGPTASAGLVFSLHKPKEQ